MLLFFYGEDNFRLKQKVKKLKEKFISSSLGDTNLVALEGARLSYDELSRQTFAMPFLSRKRLVILENFLKNAKKDLQEKTLVLIKKVPDSTVLVFQEEGIPDRRTSLFRKLNLPGQAEELKLLDEAQLSYWIKKEVENQKGTIEPEAIRKLIEFIGNDLWRMKNEIEKLISYKKQILAENVELLVKSQIEANIFTLIDQIGAKNFSRSLFELHKLLNSGANELYILTMIVYQFRNLLVVKDLLRKPNQNRWQIAKTVGLHPYVAQKTINQASNFSLPKLKEIYRQLGNFDIAIKTGKIESRTALDLIIFKLTQ